MAEPACHIGVLGPLRLELDGRVVPLPSARQRSLLALLVMSAGAPLTRDRLIEELWGERPPASAVSAIHVHLSKLRESLGGLLVLGAGGYSLDPSAYLLDARRVEEILQQAARDSPRAGALLREALSLCRGPALCDVDSEGSVARWRRELDELCLRALLLRIDADLAAGAGGELVGELERLVAEHQLEERVWGQLMRALYRDGRTGEALAVYQRARVVFARELGLEPGEPLSQLQRRILDGDQTLLAAAEKPPLVPGVRSDLPRPLSRLLGRDRELASLAELMQDPEVRLVTLTGPGGVGKTRLALEGARRMEPAYAHGAVFVRLEHVTDPALVAGEIAGAIARRDGTDGPNADGLAAHLRDRELLLVVDNFEHVLPAAALIPGLLALAPGARVLVSSRTALSVRGESVFEVRPLELPQDGPPDQVVRNPAVQLFLQAMAVAAPEHSANAEMVNTVALVCRALDGLPLAIELAASRARLLSPAEIVEQLERPLVIGAHGLRDLPDRQRTLDATIRWSYDLLPAGAKRALRHAAVFRGGFTLEALEAVTKTPARAHVQELCETSLMRRRSEGARFELLELVRAFALAELERSGEKPLALQLHREHFTALAAPACAAFDSGVAPGEIAAPMIADHANVRAALDDAINARDQESAVTLALGLRPLWLAGQLRREAQELTDRLLGCFSIAPESELALLRAAAYLDYGPNAKLWHRRVAARAAEIGDQDALVAARGNLFGHALNSKDLEEMRRLRPQLLELVTPDASPKAIGWIHYYLALGAYVDGALAEACEHASLSVENAVAAGHDVMLASAVATQLLSESARDGVITRAALGDVLDVMRRPGIAPLSAFGLWLVGRYAADVAPDTAGRWLAHAERIVVALDSQLWPESTLRDETAAVLGIGDLGPLLEATPPLDHAAALAQAAAWIAAREPGEQASRAPAPPVGSALR